MANKTKPNFWSSNGIQVKVLILVYQLDELSWPYRGQKGSLRLKAKFISKSADWPNGPR